MKANALILLLLANLCTGCYWDSSSDTVTGKYSTLWIDTEASRMLCVESDNPGSWNTIVESYVFAVGHNNRFIIAKQHPTDKDNNINSKVTNYYIIDIKDTDPKVLGPHSKEAFQEISRELNIGGMAFDKVYPGTVDQY